MSCRRSGACLDTCLGVAWFAHVLILYPALLWRSPGGDAESVGAAAARLAGAAAFAGAFGLAWAAALWRLVSDGAPARARAALVASQRAASVSFALLATLLVVVTGGACARLRLRVAGGVCFPVLSPPSLVLHSHLRALPPQPPLRPRQRWRRRWQPWRAPTRPG
jgi:hypothetical protein